MKLTEEFVEKIYLAVPNDEAIECAKLGVLDFLTSSYASKEDAGLHKLLKLIELEGGLQVAPLIGQNLKVTPQQSALVNGFLAHALDLDDVHVEVRGHPSAVILPTLIALASTNVVTGKRFLEAYAVGVETMARIARAISDGHYEKGWHNTGTIGVLAASLAGGYMLQFSREQLARVLGFATTQSSGLRCHFGTETKPLHAGLAARAAVLSVNLTTVNFSNNPTSFDGIGNYFDVYGEGTEQIASYLLDDWNEQWKIVSPGLWFKIYPFCSAAYFGADAALQIGEVNVEEIKEVIITFSNNTDAALVHQNPITSEQGRFSIEYIVSLILQGKPLTFQYFDGKSINHVSQSIMNKSVRENVKEPLSVARYTKVKVVFNNGDVIEEISTTPKGSPQNKVTKQEIIEKCKSILQNDELEDRWFKTIFSLDHAKDVSAFLSIL
nr:MmgE/PrpD family protein [Lysinibacillus timonensis]